VARHTKIVATVGPSCERPEDIDALITAGVDVFRINLSHGPLEAHLDRFERLRQRASEAGRSIGILADLPGPKLRSGEFPPGGAYLMEGESVQLVPGGGASSHERVTIEYETLLEDLHPGDSVVIGDGAILLRVEAIGDQGITARVVTGGRVQGRPGVHLPAEKLRITTPTEHDLELAAAMAAAGTDFLGVSFVRSANDLLRVRDVCHLHRPRLVAKIETAPAVACLDDILEVADAVMVARGDLGISMPLEDVPHLQKKIIRGCVEAGVPVITATQMLESMVSAPAPTRAEVTDVANAVFDGTDALMLSAETAIGEDPPLVVRTMSRIAERAEAESDYAQWSMRLGRELRASATAGPERITQALSHAAWQAAVDIGVDAIVCCTRSGRTALAMARFRPTAPLIGISPDPATARALSVAWGVLPMTVETYHSTDELVWCVVEAVVQAGHVSTGDLVAVLAGAPDRDDGVTDVLRVVRIS
jgi:pyruvate kinase